MDFSNRTTNTEGQLGHRVASEGQFQKGRDGPGRRDGEKASGSRLRRRRSGRPLPQSISEPDLGNDQVSAISQENPRDIMTASIGPKFRKRYRPQDDIDCTDDDISIQEVPVGDGRPTKRVCSKAEKTMEKATNPTGARVITPSRAVERNTNVCELLPSIDTSDFQEKGKEQAGFAGRETDYPQVRKLDAVIPSTPSQGEAKVNDISFDLLTCIKTAMLSWPVEQLESKLKHEMERLDEIDLDLIRSRLNERDAKSCLKGTEGNYKDVESAIREYSFDSQAADHYAGPRSSNSNSETILNNLRIAWWDDIQPRLISAVSRSGEHRQNVEERAVKQCRERVARLGQEKEERLRQVAIFQGSIYLLKLDQGIRSRASQVDTGLYE
ncbi:hypothetical protein FHETE_11397 [Fusarium heterosporum]|uniref:Uncharacterized protein n=1 Tax=Fusarium heterosporum TaxID=42747 RepID=A0A8H5SHY0_FUSHE|nr:hypothetical protein FHETE_11397 [Fusarium heterosporum]